MTGRPEALREPGLPDRPRPRPAPGDQTAGDDADRWREAARLRRDHPKWVVIWLTPLRVFRAYTRLPAARRDTALTATTAADLAGLIGQAEQARRAPSRKGRA